LRNKLLCLSSGGKDSILALHIAIQKQQSEIAGIITMLPEDNESMLYHTFNVHFVKKIAESIGIRWFGIQAKKDDEEDALRRALLNIDSDILISGGIASNYQKRKFDKIAEEAGMKHIAPLWGWNSTEIFSKILDLKMDVLIVGVSAYGLNQEWLGLHLTEDGIKTLLKLAMKYRFDPLGEGGDLETFVLDAPIYKQRLIISSCLKKWLGDRGMLEINELILQEKVIKDA
jgi:ABC transporter with metal-binding/Fe-S-binding domain ATP-binding protein